MQQQTNAVTAWTEDFPQQSIQDISSAQFPVKLGDVVEVTMTNTGNYPVAATFTFVNQTQNPNAPFVVNYISTDQSSFMGTSDAEVVFERACGTTSGGGSACYPMTNTVNSPFHLQGYYTAFVYPADPDNNPKYTVTNYGINQDFTDGGFKGWCAYTIGYECLLHTVSNATPNLCDSGSTTTSGTETVEVTVSYLGNPKTCPTP